MHKEATPFRKAGLFQVISSPEICQVVEIGPTTVDGMKGSDGTPLEVENV